MTALGGEPLPVEFCSGGAWHPGVLVGWLHAPDGGCRMRVQFVVGGLKRRSWLPLGDLRLAAPRPAEPVAEVVAEPRTRPDLLLPALSGPGPLPAVPVPRRHDEDLSPAHR